jgi:aspartyl-tRNA(Asn)/glutamyl-tRNA(Gln) amidotransferase subunit B
MQYEEVIGLEVHAQLKTKTKIFCSCSTKFGAAPNSQVCPVCLGMPGVLPVLNRKAVEYAVKMGLATHCTFAEHSYFARKNYFYPDLPKGYQISQFEEPLCTDGYVEIEIDGQPKKIGLVRIHLEEDAGKSIHEEDWVPEGETLVDLNRCGTPLIEIVGKPDLRSPREAYLFLAQLKGMLEYLDISDCNMEEGSLRCDANVSIRPVGSDELGVKTEVKNMNSFHGLQRALEFEVERQKSLLEQGKTITQQTLLWNAKENKVVPMRSKEESHDYRYFPEPDLVPIELDYSWQHELEQEIPELAMQKKQRFVSEYALHPKNSEVLVSSRETADFFEATVKIHKDPKSVSNFMLGEVLRYLGDMKSSIDSTQLTPALLADLLDLVERGTVSLNAAKSVLPELAQNGTPPIDIIEQRGLSQVSDESELSGIVNDVLEAHPAELQKYSEGREQIAGFFVGQVMKATKGKANPKVVNELLKEQLLKRKAGS